jgi:hypothetical protein
MAPTIEVLVNPRAPLPDPPGWPTHAGKTLPAAYLAPVRQTGGGSLQRFSVVAPSVIVSAPTIHGLF